MQVAVAPKKPVAKGKKKAAVGTGRNKLSDEKRKKSEAVIRHRVELEKKVFHMQQNLIDNNVDDATLKQAAALFQPNNYQDVVEERSLDLCCGYPACNNKLKPTQGPKQKYKLSLSEKKVYDNTELSMYCSPICLVASKVFASQLSTTPIHLRTPEDIQKLEIKVAGDLSPALGTELDTNMSEVILPYGKSNGEMDKMKTQINVRERESIPPPSMDFSSASTATEYTELAKPKLRPPSKKKPPATLPPKTDPSYSTTTPPLDSSLEIGIEDKIASMNLTPTSSPIPSSMRKKKSSGDKGNKSKKVQFDLGNGKNKKTDQDETQSDISDYDDDDGSSGSDGNIFGLQDSSEEETVITVSSFGLMWTALENWKTKETMSFIHAHKTEEPATDGDMDDTEEKLPEKSQNTLRKNALVQSLNLHLPGLRSSLGINYAVEQDLPALISTFSLSRALPSFTQPQWRTVALLFIELLSFCIPELRKQLGGSLLQREEILKKYGIRADEFKVFVDLFATQIK